MAAVVTFWWFPDEEESFLAFLESTGKVMALPFLGTQNKEELLPRPIREYISKGDPHQLFLGLENHIQEAVINEYIEGESTVGRFRVVDMKSCVIGYDRGRLLTSNQLAASNLYAYWEYPNEAKTVLVKKAPEFIRWAKKVLQWVYKATPEWHQYKNYRVSKRVKDAILNESLQIASY